MKKNEKKHSVRQFGVIGRIDLVVPDWKPN